MWIIAAPEQLTSLKLICFGTVELVLVAGQNSRRYCSNMNQSSKVTSGEVVWRIDAITVNIVKGIGSLFGLSFGFIYIKYIMG